MLGMRSRDGFGEAPARKRTTVATNSEAIAATLEGYQCSRDHRHAQLVAGRPKSCDAYPIEFCRAVCAAYAHQVVLDQAKDGRGWVGGVYSGESTDITGLMAPLVARKLGTDGCPGWVSEISNDSCGVEHGSC